LSSNLFDMKIKRIAGALGAEIIGLDLTQSPSSDLTKEIREVFLKNSVIFLRHQPLTSQQFMNFAIAMGEPIQYPLSKASTIFLKSLKLKS